MGKSSEQTLTALLAQEGLEPQPGDLERFGKLIDTYMASLRALHAIDLEGEEIGPIFHPEWSGK